MYPRVSVCEKGGGGGGVNTDAGQDSCYWTIEGKALEEGRNENMIG